LLFKIPTSQGHGVEMTDMEAEWSGGGVVMKASNGHVEEEAAAADASAALAAAEAAVVAKVEASKKQPSSKPSASKGISKQGGGPRKQGSKTTTGAPRENARLPTKRPIASSSSSFAVKPQVVNVSPPTSGLVKAGSKRPSRPKVRTRVSQLDRPAGEPSPPKSAISRASSVELDDVHSPFPAATRVSSSVNLEPHP